MLWHTYKLTGKRDRETERAVPRCLERRIWDSSCSGINEEREGRAAQKQMSCHASSTGDGVDTHTFLIPCLGWITRLQKGRFFSPPVFGIRGNLGA